jgi:hypothetical protein
MKGLRPVIVFILMLTLGGPSLRAQEGRQRPGPGAERIEQFKKIRLMDVLKMDEETSIRFFARYNKHIETLRDIEKSRNDRVDQLQKLTDSDASNDDIMKAVNDVTALDGKMTEERSKFLTDLKDVLTVKQIGKYVVFERNFNQNLRDLMRDVARDRWEHRRSE